MKESCCPWQGEGEKSAVYTTKKPTPYVAVSSEIGCCATYSTKAMADVGYRVRTGSSPGSFTLQSKVSL